MNRKKAVFELLLVLTFHNISQYLCQLVNDEYGGVVSTLLTVYFLYWRLKSNSESLRDIGIFRPSSLTVTVIASVVTIPIAMLFTIVTALTLRHFGITSQAPDIPRFNEMEGNVTLFVIWIGLALVASSSEEIIYRGFVITRLETVFNKSHLAIALILLLQALYFGFRHYYQGLVQAYAASAIGLVFGLCYILTKRNLWAVMIAHTLFNCIGITGRFLG